MTITVAAIHTTPVKGLHLHAREEIQLGLDGVEDDRRFYLVDTAGRLVNNKRAGELMAVVAELSSDGGELSLRFPDGERLSERVEAGPLRETRFFSRVDHVAPVCPTLSAALSSWTSQELTLVRVDPALGGVDRGPESAVSVISRGSLARLGELAQEAVDGRRFRMLLELDGLDPHGEDAWVDSEVRIGAARVRFGGHVGRCRVTQMDPDSGKTTLPTLKLLGYRRALDTTEPLAFGIYGGVLEPGPVRVGDRVEPLGAGA